MTVWQRFRLWRLSRPFWGGVLVMLAGLEIVGSMNLELAGGTISIGQEGFPAYLIAFTLFICGPLAWFAPAQRHFYGLIVTFVALYSLLGVNLGGFFAGMLLGVLGGALIFAWTPMSPDNSARFDSPGDTHSGEGNSSADAHGSDGGPSSGGAHGPAGPSSSGGALTSAGRHASGGAHASGGRRALGGWGFLRRANPHGAEPAAGSERTYPEESVSSGEEPGPDRPSLPRNVATVIFALTIGLSALAAPARVDAVGPCPTPTPAASPSPTRSPGPVEDFIGDIFDFFGRLIGGGRPRPSPTPTPSPKPSPCPTPSGSVSPSPGTPGKPTATPSPTAPGAPGKPGANPPAAPRVVESTFIARRAGRMTGSRVSMNDLVFEGVVELPLKAGGTVRVLKFSMTQSDTDDFTLKVFGDKGWDTELKSSRLTVRGEAVLFYTSRFRANLFGLIPVDYTPDSLPPPIPLPFVFFTNPDIQLVLVDSPELLAPRLRINQVRAA